MRGKSRSAHERLRDGIVWIIPPFATDSRALVGTKVGVATLDVACGEQCISGGLSDCSHTSAAAVSSLPSKHSKCAAASAIKTAPDAGATPAEDPSSIGRRHNS